MTRIILVIAFVFSLLLIGALRYSGYHTTPLTPLSSYATVAYIIVTIIFTMMMVRAGFRFDRIGFQRPVSFYFIALGVIGAVFIEVQSTLLAPVLENLFGAPRDLARFDAVHGSLRQLVVLLALSWTFAAFGEELVFRIILLKSIRQILGGGGVATVFALIFQALVFGMLHAYQGPAGIAATTTNGLIFGILVLAGRGSIWPAAIAHGLVNSVGLITLYANG